jgi:hypothetical protein
MIPLSTILPSLLLFLVPTAHASAPADLVGTWSSKSNTVITGPVCSPRTTHPVRANEDIDRISTTPRERNSKNHVCPVAVSRSRRMDTSKRQCISSLRIVCYPGPVPFPLLRRCFFFPWLVCGVAGEKRESWHPAFFFCLIFLLIIQIKNTATVPRCPSAYLQWQHGEYIVNPDGSIDLHPIQVDGRQLKSDHCTSDKALYTRFNQTERLKVRPSTLQIDLNF